MLPGLSGSMSEMGLVRERSIGKRAADLTEDLSWGQPVRPGISVLEQWWESLVGMRVGDGTTKCSPEPLDAVGVRIVGGRVDQHELTSELRQQVSQQERAIGCMDAQVIQHHQGNPATCLRALDRSA